MRYLTTSEVAKILNVSERQLRRMRQTEGAGPAFVTFGVKTIRYSPAAVSRWLNEHSSD
ncbi:helix-turn-helix transcriptional regulator [Bifidobacterium sp. ESL0820]|uniref:helix-turn-helix transcriptional regulator n=1 Tax=Bifidobacterium sp. ESL0820 TaxID=3448586 RepID=UPI0040418347